MNSPRAVFVTLVLGLMLAGLPGCRRAEPVVAQPLPTRQEIWAAIQPRAERYRMDPAFIYALVAAESNFDPRARNGSARGLLQLQPAAWRTVSSQPYEPTIWDWRTNLETGIDYLAYTRSTLQRKGVPFSYPVLLASFHYGLGYMEDRGFDAARVRVPDNAVYRELWAGRLNPLPVPP
jgi:soluble lytic murein transglycosylase-like protein